MDESSVYSRMREVINLVTTDASRIRTGRATPAIVEDLQVSVYDGQQKLGVNELATISATDNQSIVIDPWDKSIIGEIKQGIEAANVGLNPIIDGELIRINLPPLTSEDREKFIKLLNAKLEAGKVMIRQIRGDIMQEIKKGFEEKELTEDEKFNQEKRLQQITDEYVEKIVKLGKTKEEELLRI